MTTEERRRHVMLTRVRQFGEAHADLFASSAVAREHFATVAAVVEELREHAVDTMSAARAGKGRKATARKALLAQLGEISRTARAIAQKTPGLDDMFHLPDSRNDQALLTAGRLFARDAEAFTGHFVAHSLPSTFIADLQQAVEAFEEAIVGRDAEQDGHAATRVTIRAALSTATAAVKQLDAIVANHLRGDPATLVVWQRDRRVGHPSRPRHADPVAEAAPGAAAPLPVGEVTS